MKQLTFILLVAVLLYAIPSTNSNSQDARPVGVTKITGDDELFDADVIFEDGQHALVTSGTVKVEEIFGQDPHATSWFYIGTAEDASGVGGIGDTIRIQIPAAVTPIGTVYPAVDVTTTVTAAHTGAANPERELALDICTDLESDTNFQNAEWNCIVIKDHSGVFIESNLYNEFGERTSWTVTATGTTIVTQAYLSFERRGLPTELDRSPNDPRQGILGISGTVVSTPGGIGDIQVAPLLNNVASADMRIDCDPYVAGTCDFKISCNSNVRFINEIRVFGGCNGIKFGQHLCKNQDLANGISVSITSEAETLTLPLMYATEDWKNKFSFGPAGPGGNFRIDVQAGADQFIAVFSFGNPALLRPCGELPAPDDEIVIKIQDNLSGSPGGNLNEFSAYIQGFEEEP